jgi:hypothetical protein
MSDVCVYVMHDEIRLSLQGLRGVSVCRNAPRGFMLRHVCIRDYPRLYTGAELVRLLFEKPRARSIEPAHRNKSLLVHVRDILGKHNASLK